MFLRLPDKLVPLKRWSEWLWKWNFKLNAETIPLLAVLLTLMGSVVALFLPTFSSEDHRDSPKNFWRYSLSLCPALALPLCASSTQDLRTPWRLGALWCFRFSYLTFYNSHTSCDLTDDWWLICKARCPKDFALIKKSLKSTNKPPENGADGARFYLPESRGEVGNSVGGDI